MRKQCEFEGCTNEKGTATYCQAHAKQLATGKPLTPLREYHLRPTAPDGYAYCNRCLTFKKVDAFYRLKSGKTRHICKKCQVDLNREIRNRKRQQA